MLQTANLGAMVAGADGELVHHLPDGELAAVLPDGELAVVLLHGEAAPAVAGVLVRHQAAQADTVV